MDDEASRLEVVPPTQSRAAVCRCCLADLNLNFGRSNDTVQERSLVKKFGTMSKVVRTLAMLRGGPIMLFMLMHCGRSCASFWTLQLSHPRQLEKFAELGL